MLTPQKVLLAYDREVAALSGAQAKARTLDQLADQLDIVAGDFRRLLPEAANARAAAEYLRSANGAVGNDLDLILRAAREALRSSVPVLVFEHQTRAQRG